jgi:uncharacterized phage protein (TIGR01671 family)
MMEEIKFRAFDIENKVMYPENTINLFLDLMGSVFCTDGRGKIQEVKNMKLLQFTGFKDKNGKEIYEGDIVQYLDGNEWSTESGYNCEEFNNHGVVFFDTECGRYDVTNKQGISYEDLFDCGVDFVVLGNIHENTELLKKEV